MSTKPLPALAAFACVARHASFTRAAAELGVSPSALSQTLRGLEAELGVRLLHRTTRRVGLTEHGERFLHQLRPALAQIDAALDDLDRMRDHPGGLLRITLARIAAERLVLPRMRAFHRRYPEVQVELSIDPALVDLVAAGFDAGIRLGESLAKDMVALPISPWQRQVIVGTPDYFARHPPPRTPQELIDHDCIRYRRSNGRLMPFEFIEDGRDFTVEVTGSFIVNGGELGYALALQGLGLAQVFESMAAADVAAGRLQRVLDEWQQPFDGFYIYYPARQQLPPKLRVFVDFLREPLLENILR